MEELKMEELTVTNTISIIKGKRLSYYSGPAQFRLIKDAIEDEAIQKVRSAMKNTR